MQIEHIVPDSKIKAYIVYSYIGMKYDISYFTNYKYALLADKLCKYEKFKTTNIIELIMLSVTLIEQFHITETELIDIIDKDDLLNFTYNLVKDTPEIKMMMNEAEVTHLVKDPLIGEFKSATIQ